MTYTLGGALGETSVSPGTNVLLTGPPLSGKRRLARAILERGLADGDGAVVISTRDTADRVQSLFESTVGETVDDQIGVVDCISEHVGRTRPETEMVRYVASPTDLRRTGIKFTEFIEYFQRERERQSNRVMLDSITTLLQYSSFQTVFQFLHGVTVRVSEVDAVGVYVVESTVHDEETMGTIRELFDCVVEIGSDGTLTGDFSAVDGEPDVPES